LIMKGVVSEKKEGRPPEAWGRKQWGGGKEKFFRRGEKRRDTKEKGLFQKNRKNRKRKGERKGSLGKNPVQIGVCRL